MQSSYKSINDNEFEKINSLSVDGFLLKNASYFGKWRWNDKLRSWNSAEKIAFSIKYVFRC